MPDFNKMFPTPIATDDGRTLSTLGAAADYARLKKAPAWDWARRQVTRAAMSDHAADLTAAFAAVQNAILLDGMRSWRSSA